MSDYIKKINYPILLLAIYVIANLRSFVFGIINFFTGLFSDFLYLPLRVLSLAGIVATVAILVLLILEKNNKIKDSKKWVALAVIISAVNFLKNIICELIRFDSLVNSFENFYTLTMGSVFDHIVDLMILVMLIMIGVNLIRKNKPMPKIFIVIFAVTAVFVCFVGILRVSVAVSYLSKALLTLIYMMALLYIPNVYNENKVATTEITAGKIKILCAAIVFIIVMAVMSAGANSTNDNDYSDGDPNKCRICGRVGVIPGFRMCGDCFDGFSDWQEDNWK